MEWRDIPGFEGYRISENGDVQTRWVKHGCKSWLGDEWKDMKYHTNKTGYHRVSLRISPSKKKMSLVHVLVLITFDSPRPNGLIARHIDDNKDNNHISNLTWGTHKENSNDCLINGNRVMGENHYKTALTKEDVTIIRSSYDDDMTESKKWNLSRDEIYKIRTFESWNEGGKLEIKRKGYFKKLTEEQYEEIRNSTETTVALAKKFGVSQSHVSHIKLGHRRLKKKD